METEQLQPITIHPQHGLAYCDDFAPIRSMLKHEPSMQALVDAIERDALGLVADPMDREGSRQIRENADWVKKCARRLEEIRTKAVAALKREPKLVEDAVRPHVKRLEALAAQVMAPVAEMDARADALRIYADRPNILTAAPIDQLRRELDAARAWDDSEAEWKERAEEAKAVKLAVSEALEAMLAKREREDAERQELERLRAQEAERQRQADLEAARLDGERKAKERMEREKAEREAADEARAKRAAAEAVASEAAAEARAAKPAAAKQMAMQASPNPAESLDQQAYDDLQKTFRMASYRDPIRYVLDEIKRGNIRHITANI